MATCLKSVLLPCLVGLAPTIAHAGDEDLSCRNGDFSARSATFAAARVVGTGRLHFLDDTDGCPSEAKACIGRAYVVPGDRLIVGRRHAGYRCAYFPGDRDGSAGWVQEGRLAVDAPAAAPALKDWQGHWQYVDDTLDLTVAGTALKVEGNAYWPSANPPPEGRPGGPNLGAIEAEAVPTGYEVHFADGGESYSCHLHAVLVGSFLLVDDNGQCGGLNVRFNGVYRRGEATPAAD